MVKSIIGIGLIFLVGIIALASSIMKRKIILNYRDLKLSDFFQYKIWLSLSMNPYVWLIALTLVSLFCLNFIIAYILPVNKSTIITWVLSFPMWLIGLLISHYYLGESIKKSQYFPILIILLGTLISIWGIKQFFQNS